MKEIFIRYKNQLIQVGFITMLSLVLLLKNIELILFYTYQYQPSIQSTYLFSLSISIILTLWAHYDSRQSGFSFGLDQAMYIFFGWPLMFPLYVFYSRGVRRGCLLLLMVLGIVIFNFLAAFVITTLINLGSMIISFY